jgi:hypothetical protein
MGPTTLSQKKNLGVAISCDMRQSLLNRLEEVERIIMESFAPRIIIFIQFLTMPYFIEDLSFSEFIVSVVPFCFPPRETKAFSRGSSSLRYA